MNVAELLKALDDFGSHLEVKVELEETTKYGQHNFEVDDARDDEDGTTIVVLRVLGR